MQQYDNYKLDAAEKVLFIIDYSNSMNEFIGRERKIDLVLKTMNQILPTISPNVWVGLRVYGHRAGFITEDACMASSLVNPISPANSVNIQKKLQELTPRGMTPITYSLKQAINKDFVGFSGQKHIILLTDGGENCDESPCKFIMGIIPYRKDIRIDVIAFSIDNQDDLNQLECTSSVTSGKFYTANTAGQLIDSLQKSLNTTKRVEGKILLNY